MNLELGGGKKKNHFKGREYREKSSLVVFILNLDGEGVQIMEMEFQRFNLYQSLILANDKCLKEVSLWIFWIFSLALAFMSFFKLSVRWLWFFNFKSRYSFLLQVFWVTLMISDKNMYSLDANTLLKCEILHRNRLILKTHPEMQRILFFFFFLLNSEVF